MNESLIEQYVFHQWHLTSWWEITAVFFGVLQVLLAYRNNVLLYPAGIISTSIFITLFAQPQTGLYAEASLNLYYLVMSIYGWIYWSVQSKTQGSVIISTCSKKEKGIAAGIFFLGFLLLYTILDRFTDSNVPYMDAIVSAAAWSGMWLLARRKLENWLVLNVSNAIAIPLLFYKGMPLTALLTVFLFIVAIFGYFNWKKLRRKQFLHPSLAEEAPAHGRA